VIIDASVWVSMLSDTEVNYQSSRRWFRARLARADDLMIPSLALAEVAGAIARRQASIDAALRAIDWMLQLPHLQVAPLHEGLAFQAADIAATYRLRGADAVNVAAAAERAVPLVTWDRVLLQRAASIVDVTQP